MAIEKNWYSKVNSYGTGSHIKVLWSIQQYTTKKYTRNSEQVCLCCYEDKMKKPESNPSGVPSLGNFSIFHENIKNSF